MGFLSFLKDMFKEEEPVELEIVKNHKDWVEVRIKERK